MDVNENRCGGTCHGIFQKYRVNELMKNSTTKIYIELMKDKLQNLNERDNTLGSFFVGIILR